MAKKKDFDLPEKAKFWQEMREESVQVIISVFCFLVTILSLLAAFKKAGVVGEYSFLFFFRMFGIGYYLIPMIFAMLGISFLRSLKKKIGVSKVIGALLLLISSLGLIHISYYGAGGIVGRWVATPLIKLIDYLASGVFLVAVIIVSVIMIFDLYFTWNDIAEFFARRKARRLEKETEKAITSKAALEETEEETEIVKTVDSIRPKGNETAKNKANDKKKGGLLDFTDDEEMAFASVVSLPHLKPYNPPPLSLLEQDRGKPENGDIKARANIIKRTLHNFGITVEMDEISIGPSVTRYSLKPAEGVKLSKIVALNADLALALAAHPIRIEAPIPGKSLVGIEVPNIAKTTVGLATLLGSPDFRESEKPLLMSLGKDITGSAHFSNLGKAPHMLIAGATGSGKSVTIHALITSLLYRNSPENLKFIMVDPKRVELTMYNKIPHLLAPVITDPKKAILALKWAAKEMTRRYDVFEKNGSRDIASYHKNVLAPALAKMKGKDTETKIPETMPFLVIVIDELADIMQAYPRELESAIVRLAQMSRATGIHLIISTQRPSVNVITGLIKANIPTRVALQVASQIDSRTILDQMGAEKLLGSGDMLYLGSEMSKPVRLQSAFITEAEVKSVVKYLINEYKDEIMDSINLTPTEAGASAAFDAMSEDGSLEEEDDLYENAREIVISSNKASTSFLQRKLGVGYSRAAKLIDSLEEHGVIGPANGSKAREVIGGGQSNIDMPSESVENNGNEAPISQEQEEQ